MSSLALFGCFGRPRRDHLPKPDGLSAQSQGSKSGGQTSKAHGPSPKTPLAPAAGTPARPSPPDVVEAAAVGMLRQLNIGAFGPDASSLRTRGAAHSHPHQQQQQQQQQHNQQAAAVLGANDGAPPIGSSGSSNRPKQPGEPLQQVAAAHDVSLGARAPPHAPPLYGDTLLCLPLTEPTEGSAPSAPFLEGAASNTAGHHHPQQQHDGSLSAPLCRSAGSYPGITRNNAWSGAGDASIYAPAACDAGKALVSPHHSGKLSLASTVGSRAPSPRPSVYQGSSGACTPRASTMSEAPVPPGSSGGYVASRRSTTLSGMAPSDAADSSKRLSSASLHMVDPRITPDAFLYSVDSVRADSRADLRSGGGMAPRSPAPSNTSRASFVGMDSSANFLADGNVEVTGLPLAAMGRRPPTKHASLSVLGQGSSGGGNTSSGRLPCIVQGRAGQSQPLVTLPMIAQAVQQGLHGNGAGGMVIGCPLPSGTPPGSGNLRHTACEDAAGAELVAPASPGVHVPSGRLSRQLIRRGSSGLLSARVTNTAVVDLFPGSHNGSVPPGSSHNGSVFPLSNTGTWFQGSSQNGTVNPSSHNGALATSTGAASSSSQLPKLTSSALMQQQWLSLSQQLGLSGTPPHEQQLLGGLFEHRPRGEQQALQVLLTDDPFEGAGLSHTGVHASGGTQQQDGNSRSWHTGSTAALNTRSFLTEPNATMGLCSTVSEAEAALAEACMAAMRSPKSSSTSQPLPTPLPTHQQLLRELMQPGAEEGSHWLYAGKVNTLHAPVVAGRPGTPPPPPPAAPQAGSCSQAVAALAAAAPVDGLLVPGAGAADTAAVSGNRSSGDKDDRSSANDRSFASVLTFSDAPQPTPAAQPPSLVRRLLSTRERNMARSGSSGSGSADARAMPDTFMDSHMDSGWAEEIMSDEALAAIAAGRFTADVQYNYDGFSLLGNIQEQE